MASPDEAASTALPAPTISVAVVLGLRDGRHAASADAVLGALASLVAAVAVAVAVAGDTAATAREEQ